MLKKTPYIAALSFAALFLSATVVLGAEEEKKTPESLVGKVSPTAKLKTLDGADLDLAAFKDKEYVVIDFWATWCPWCRKSTEDFIKLSKQYADEDVQFFIVSVGEKAETVKAYAEKNKIDANFILDGDLELAKGYAVDLIPHMAIIGKDGVVKDVAIGAGTAHKDIAATLEKIFPAKKAEAAAS